MPKLKTNRAAAKRFRKTAKGFKRAQSNRRHILTACDQLELIERNELFERKCIRFVGH